MRTKLIYRHVLIAKIICIILCFSTNTYCEGMPQYILDRAIDHGVNITKNYPPETHHIINFGPTSTAIASAIRELTKDSKKAKNYMSEIAITGVKNVDKYSTDQLDKLFEKIIPSNEVLKGRKIVLNRSIHGGRSMNNFMPVLLDFLKRKRSNTKLTYYWLHQFAKDKLHFVDRVTSHPNFEQGTLIRDPEFTHYLFNYIDTDVFSASRSELTDRMMYKEISLEEAITKGCCEKNPKFHGEKNLDNHIRERIKALEVMFDSNIYEKCMMFMLTH